jgi:hypothetical protein
VANAVVATLEGHGIRCWIAPRDILPGEDWGEAIIDAIKAAHAMIIVFSSHSNESEQIKREVERAVHDGIAVIPLRIEDVLPSKTLEYFISTQHWLDALTPPMEDHLAHLAETIKVLLAKKGFKDKSPGLEKEEPAPPQPERPPVAPPLEVPPPSVTIAPPRKVPLVWLSAVIGLLAVLGLIGWLWHPWSRPAVPTPQPTVPPVTEPRVAPAPPGTTWVYVVLESKDKDYKAYYNNKTIIIDKNNHVIDVWVKRKYSEKGKSEFLEVLTEHKEYNINYLTVDYSLVHYLINYNDMKYIVKNITYYSVAGETLFKQTFPDEWSDIPQKSTSVIYGIASKIVSDYSLK